MVLINSLILINRLFSTHVERVKLQSILFDTVQLAPISYYMVEGISTVSMISNSQRHVEVFLIYNADHKNRRSYFESFFNKKQNELEQNILNKPIFFKEDRALNYMRFIDTNHCILRAYVPESSIEGHFDELCLKKGCLFEAQVHGCYPSYGCGHKYIANPEFDENLLSLVGYHHNQQPEE